MSRSRTPRRLAQVLIACALVAVTSASAAAATRVDRVVVVMRHGIRAPIVGEAPEGTRTGDPWPSWPVPAEHLTPHGARALEVLGRSDRAWFAKLGVLPAQGCPASGQVRIWTNTAERTIASGEAFAEGLAPGCGLPVGHLAASEVDPLFEPLRAGVAPFDPAAAIASINAHTGGVDRLAARLKPQLEELDRVLGCGAPTGCQPEHPSGVKPSGDGRGVDLSGPIRDASGTAQVLLLQYVEGLSPSPPRWRAVEPGALKRLGALHAALFNVFTRPPYMTARQAGPLARRVREALAAPTTGVDVFVGHDTNVTALGAALGAPLSAPGYATGDVPPGGALVFLRLVDDAGRRWIEVRYQTQSPQALRRARDAVSRPAIAVWGRRVLSLDAFDRRLSDAVRTDASPSR
ncbi:histidine-type phosphatase [Caulobacter segnis]|uniref:histidine-type phosphatase n=1 Tax=Caulobacter segnis TaxID=88688 RepID=UPI0026CC202F|nr:histidine-type phosphatase [Caulobacter segnis]